MYLRVLSTTTISLQSTQITLSKAGIEGGAIYVESG